MLLVGPTRTYPRRYLTPLLVPYHCACSCILIMNNTMVKAGDQIRHVMLWFGTITAYPEFLYCFMKTVGSKRAGI